MNINILLNLPVLLLLIYSVRSENVKFKQLSRVVPEVISFDSNHPPSVESYVPVAVIYDEQKDISVLKESTKQVASTTGENKINIKNAGNNSVSHTISGADEHYGNYSPAEIKGSTPVAFLTNQQKSEVPIAVKSENQDKSSAILPQTPDIKTTDNTESVKKPKGRFLNYETNTSSKLEKDSTTTEKNIKRRVQRKRLVRVSKVKNNKNLPTNAEEFIKKTDEKQVNPSIVKTYRINNYRETNRKFNKLSLNKNVPTNENKSDQTVKQNNEKEVKSSLTETFNSNDYFTTTTTFAPLTGNENLPIIENKTDAIIKKNYEKEVKSSINEAQIKNGYSITNTKFDTVTVNRNLPTIENKTENTIKKNDDKDIKLRINTTHKYDDNPTINRKFDQVTGDTFLRTNDNKKEATIKKNDVKEATPRTIRTQIRYNYSDRNTKLDTVNKNLPAIANKTEKTVNQNDDREIKSSRNVARNNNNEKTKVTAQRNTRKEIKPRTTDKPYQNTDQRLLSSSFARSNNYPTTSTTFNEVTTTRYVARNNNNEKTKVAVERNFRQEIKPRTTDKFNENNDQPTTSTSFLKRTQERDPFVPIVESENYVYANKGDFHYSYEAGDGTKAFERGELKTIEDGSSGTGVVGGFSYTDKDGNDFSLSYTADENGYRPIGAHLPTSPPIPIAIQRALAILATKTTPEPITERVKTSRN